MIDHVIEIEGPIYFDVLIDRSARVHGFQRSGELRPNNLSMGAAFGVIAAPRKRVGSGALAL